MRVLPGLWSSSRPISVIFTASVISLGNHYCSRVNDSLRVALYFLTVDPSTTKVFAVTFKYCLVDIIFVD